MTEASLAVEAEIEPCLQPALKSPYPSNMRHVGLAESIMLKVNM